MTEIPGPAFIAGGTIAPSRGVKISTAADKTVLQGGANELAFGIAQPGQKGAPGVTGSDSDVAAAAGDQIEVIGPGRVAKLRMAGAVTRGNKVQLDADGKGVILGSTAANRYNALGWLLESSTAAEDLCDVFIFPHSVTIPA
jgi:hypothetical protein